jgi:predicted nucleic acid-binding protein
MLEPLFVDTGYLLAYVNKNDQHHDEALKLSEQYNGYPLVTTDAVLLEVGNALSRGGRVSAVEIIHHFQESGDVTLVHMNPVLFRQAFQMYESYRDKEWGMVDCLSFLVMREMKLTSVLAFDKHFEQAGFNRLKAQ